MAETAKKAPNSIDRHVGARIRMRRLMLGLSQQKLADALGLTFQQVQKYENGTNKVGAGRLQQMSRTLQVEPAFFFEGAPAGPIVSSAGPDSGLAEATSPAYIADFLATAEGVHLNKAFARITDTRVRRRIIDLVNAIADSQSPET